MGILDEVDMGANRLEAGLLLREAILLSGLLYSAEAWSNVTEKQLARLEVVDTTLLKKLAGGHSKSATEFVHLETGTWKLRHHLTYLRLLYHHHILTREDSETIKKIYLKKKEESANGDWIKLLEKDFLFIECEMDEETIAATPKETYKKNIKNMINKSAFKYFMQIKETHSKLDQLEYTELKIQPYLKSLAINNKEKELLFNIRSKSHHSKDNFRKLYRNNLNCSFTNRRSNTHIHRLHKIRKNQHPCCV